mmetsp:Transcript_63964/g.187648  ORF Transcript_63964/g.187648 Transcript_63964/m.187648 type:complete len:224 (+) Transcript_63964:77-748(+)
MGGTGLRRRGCGILNSPPAATPRAGNTELSLRGHHPVELGDCALVLLIRVAALHLAVLAVGLLEVDHVELQAPPVDTSNRALADPGPEGAAEGVRRGLCKGLQEGNARLRHRLHLVGVVRQDLRQSAREAPCHEAQGRLRSRVCAAQRLRESLDEHGLHRPNRLQHDGVGERLAQDPHGDAVEEALPAALLPEVLDGLGHAEAVCDLVVLDDNRRVRQKLTDA